MSDIKDSLSRRRVIQAGVALGVAASTGNAFAAAPAALPQILKTIPGTNVQLPPVGIGTNAYGVSDPAQLAELKRVLQAQGNLGGRVIDTANSYGTSEDVLGQLISELGNRDKFFLATKTPSRADFSAGKAVLDQNFQRLKVDRIDLLQIHNIGGVPELMPHFKEYKAAGRIRFIGVTTSSDRQYDQLIAAINSGDFDFIQVDYSLGNRTAADRVLPLAQEKGLGVLINVPFGGRGGALFSRVGGQQVPAWATAEFDATTWAQVFLKYIISHPAVTSAIPGTTTIAHLEDNQQASRGRLPNAAQRKRLEEFWDALPG
jgi:aryl-alcohol dehydrogenase-like predicted oxidoreductase